MVNWISELYNFYFVEELKRFFFLKEFGNVNKKIQRYLSVCFVILFKYFLLNRLCGCNFIGSLDNFVRCNFVDGICMCKENVDGRICDR